MTRNRILVVLSIATLALALPSAASSVDTWDGVAGEPIAEDAPAFAAEFPEPFGPLTLFHDPQAFRGTLARVDFDDADHHDAVNVRYLDAGVRIERDDGGAVHAYDLCACGYDTSSPPMVACTTRGPGSSCVGCAMHLIFAEDMHAAGFVVGNDARSYQVWTIEVFDAGDALVGRVHFTANQNGDADEFVGIASPVPFRRLRVSQSYPRLAVCLDDVTFSTRRILGR